MVSPSCCPCQGPGCLCLGMGLAGCWVRAAGLAVSQPHGHPQAGAARPATTTTRPPSCPMCDPEQRSHGAHSSPWGSFGFCRSIRNLIAPPSPVRPPPPPKPCWLDSAASPALPGDPQPQSLESCPQLGPTSWDPLGGAELFSWAAARAGGLAPCWIPQGTPRRHQDLLWHLGPWGQQQELGWDPALHLLALGLGCKGALLGCTGLEMGWAGLEMGCTGPCWAVLGWKWVGLGWKWAGLEMGCPGLCGAVAGYTGLFWARPGPCWSVLVILGGTELGGGAEPPLPQRHRGSVQGCGSVRGCGSVLEQRQPCPRV